MADESDQEKTEEPSAHRIEESRRKGEVASSKELSSVLVLSASLMTLGLSIVFIYEEMDSFVRWLAHLDVATAFTEKSLSTIAHRTAKTALVCAAPVSIVALCVGIIANVSQVGFLFATDVLQWKPERINPIEGVKKLFSARAAVEALKGVFKFIIVMAIVYMFLKDDIASYMGFFHMDFFQSFLHGKDILIKLGFSIIGGLLLVAIGDFAYQKHSYKKKMMMTKEEAKRESKEQDGNPEVKQRIRSIQREMASKRMMADIPTADAIITNPTHISIVLKYDSETMISPTIIGKGQDNLALKIREIAKEHDIPIVENVPLARALYKSVKVGEGVPRTLYKAVAEVLAFVYKLKRSKGALG
ncbi:flagellar biosynthesis protein FlhB [Bacteriovorax sp. DB6_IX]|uniref:flagellar biosynthesis protein FlhB n=1 Tax=Bacteriovorax sp. DB6_IX TaxID=1353530 RepID=UPI00038A1267|nr:flagellar biosynthesis protein FlhB [Bacteriovorax sp. DB6_IX]EQC51511.1 flagellar biosynthetic protein FlhB [Bacteriovorax sp. DB6_IX]